MSISFTVFYLIQVLVLVFIYICVFCLKIFNFFSQVSI